MAEVEQPKVDERKLESLSESEKSASPTVKAPTNKSTQEQKKMDEVDDKLSDLLGGD